MSELKGKFPEGTVQFRSDNHRPYIPNQVYTDRLESATKSQWNKEIKDLEINANHRYVKAVVRITIDPHFRDGYGFSPIDGDPLNEPHKIAFAVDKAVNDAFLGAMDSYQMGWKDLAPYKEWGGNPALRHLLKGDQNSSILPGGVTFEAIASAHHQCIKCGIELTADEWEILGQVPNLNREKMKYCYNHLPEHMKKKINDSVRKNFEMNG